MILIVVLGILVAGGVEYFSQLKKVDNLNAQVAEMDKTIQNLKKTDVQIVNQVNQIANSQVEKKPTNTNKPIIEDPFKDFPIVKQDFTMPSAEDFFSSYGTVDVIGYLLVERRICKPGDMCGKAIDHASLVLTENPSSTDFIAFIAMDKKDKTSVIGEKIGLGCYEKDDNRIFSYNFGTSTASTSTDGSVENIIQGVSFIKLINSSEEQPVKLRITKPKPALGRVAPDCYSFFRYFKIY
ncbi:MAG: hypothetical protein ABIH87_02120 [bacterium]